MRRIGAAVAGVLLPAAVLGLSGCAMRSDVNRIERQLQTQHAADVRGDSLIAASVASLARLLQAVADSLAAQQQAMTQLRGDSRTELYDIRQQLVAIQELTGQSQQRLSELRGQLEQSRTTATAPAAAGTVPGTTPGAAPADPTAEQLLDLSLQQLRRGSPGTARAGFAEFLRRYPNHARTADALYFTGEAWSADQRADSAAVAYRAVVDRFPQSNRAPSSLYKLGLQALAAGRNAEARDAFNRVVTTYPNAEEAALARDRLRTVPQR